MRVSLVSVPARRSSTRSWLDQLAVANVERFVVDQQAQDLAVGDVDDGLSGLWVAEARFGVGQRSDFVERVQIRAGQAVRLAFVEVAANSDVPVGQREQRLRLRQHIEVQPGLADLPGFDGEGVIRDHRRVLQQIAEVGDHDIGAVAA